MKITLANLSQATTQQVFDQVATHLLTQMKKSELVPGSPSSLGESYSQCVYRNPDGLMCAAGCLIGDDEYTEEMEGYNWNDWATRAGLDPYHTDLILYLQQIHDTYQPVSWGERLETTAKLFKLSDEVLHTSC